jgi:hypothetical protein
MIEEQARRDGSAKPSGMEQLFQVSTERAGGH